MKCPNCGNTLPDSAKFCPKCGMKRPASGVLAADSGRSQETAPNTPAQSGPPHVRPPKNHSNTPVMIVIIAAVLVIGCISAGAALLIVTRPDHSAATVAARKAEAGGGERRDAPKETVAADSQASRGTSAPARTDSPAAVTAPARTDSPAAVTAPARTDSPAAVTAPARTDSPAAVTAPAEPEGAETPPVEDGYILPDSSARCLTDQDLAGLSSDQLRLARNEIYARHGRKFKDKQLQAYFNSQPWYRGTVEPDSFNDSALLSDVERKNLELIKAREAALDGTTN